MQGYFYLTLGKEYIDHCVLLVQTLRKANDNRPIALLIHESDEEYARSKGIFDTYVHFKPSGALWDECVTSFEKYCLYPRLELADYLNQLPYDEIIVTDVDVLCQYSSEHVWSYMSRQSLPIRMLGRLNDPSWHWGTINQVSLACKKHVPHVHGGFFYIRKAQYLTEFFNAAKYAFWNYDALGCKRMFRGGRVDEILFAIAHANLGLQPIEFDDFPIMTFNYSPNVPIPSSLQTEGNQNVYMRDCIPFVHMFDKMEGSNFKALYNAIMSSSPKNDKAI